MNTKVSWAVFVLLVLAGGIAYAARAKPAPESVSASNGSYVYACDNGELFVMVPSADMNSIHIAPYGGGAFPPASVLARRPAGTGARFEGNGMIFTAEGETVRLTTDSSTLCTPKQNGTDAPFNFGY